MIADSQSNIFTNKMLVDKITAALAIAIFSAALGTLRGFINVTYNLNYKKAKVTGSPPSNGSEYDYIVVGTGTSGSVVAGRLAEAGHRILIVEAGGPPHFLQKIPGLFSFFLNTPYDWGYKLKQKGDIGGVYNDRSIPYPRGQSLGGTRLVQRRDMGKILCKLSLVWYCSVLNGMVYFRGHSKDFDEWEKLRNPGWGWKDVLPFFKKAEKWTGSDDTYGTDGHLNIRPSPYTYKVLQQISEHLQTNPSAWRRGHFVYF